jgi:hypothetical protein
MTRCQVHQMLHTAEHGLQVLILRHSRPSQATQSGLGQVRHSRTSPHSGLGQVRHSRPRKATQSGSNRAQPGKWTSSQFA